MKKSFHIFFYIGCLLLLVGLTADVKAQENSSRGIDIEPYNFGFIFGVNAHSFKIDNQPNFTSLDTLGIQRISNQYQNGFSVGIITNLRLTKYFDLRFIPQISFVDRSLVYSYNNSQFNISKNIESNYVELPLLLKYKSARRRNVRMYLIGGIKNSFDIISTKKITQGEDNFDPTTKKVKVKRNVLAYEFGVGLDLYYPYFKFSPELKVTNGLNNILSKEDHYYSQLIEGLFVRSISLSLQFE